jgi:Asp/Glu/hydantoin racemase
MTAPGAGAPRPLVLLNGNTSAALTDAMVAAARPLAPAGLPIVGRTAPFGEAYIATPAAFAAASHAVAAMAATAAGEAPAPGAVVVACFGDPGLAAARSLLPCPVVGMAEASVHAACQLARRFGIVTGGRAWGPMLEDHVAGIGLAARLTGVAALDLDGAELAADPATAERMIAEAAARLVAAGAGAVILGGAGLVGFASRLAASSPAPLLDSLACAVSQALALAATLAASR